MAAISTLGYVCVIASNLDAWETFAVDILGLHAERRDGALALRMDEYEQRILIIEGFDDDMVAAGWKFDTADALESFIKQLAARGIHAERCDAALLASRRVERAYACVDPDGMQHEFFYGPAYAHRDRSARKCCWGPSSLARWVSAITSVPRRTMPRHSLFTSRRWD